MKTVITAGLFVSYCFYSTFSYAATFVVDCDAGGKIMEASAQAKPGDTILTSGACNEHVNIAPEHVRLTLDGQKKTTLKHPGGNRSSVHRARGSSVTPSAAINRRAWR